MDSGLAPWLTSQLWESLSRSSGLCSATFLSAARQRCPGSFTSRLHLPGSRLSKVSPHPPQHTPWIGGARARLCLQLAVRARKTAAPDGSSMPLNGVLVPHIEHGVCSASRGERTASPWLAEHPKAGPPPACSSAGLAPTGSMADAEVTHALSHAPGTHPVHPRRGFDIRGRGCDETQSCDVGRGRGSLRRGQRVR